MLLYTVHTLLGSRAPSTMLVDRQLLSRALQRLASDEGEEPEARQHGYRPLHRQLDTDLDTQIALGARV